MFIVEEVVIMSKPKFDKLKKQFESGKEFSITEKEYLKKTGTTMPVGKYYLEKNSAIAREAKEYGMTITLTEKHITFKPIHNKE